MKTTPIEKNPIETTVQYLIPILRQRPIRVSEWYNENLSEEALIKQIGLTDEEAKTVDAIYGSAIVCIDLAVQQLWLNHLAVTRELEHELPDGNKDYEVALSIKGRQKLEAGFQPKYIAVDN